jgi:hypothetical protein
MLLSFSCYFPLVFTSYVFNEWGTKQEKTNDNKISLHLPDFEEALKRLNDTDWIGAI